MAVSRITNDAARNLPIISMLLKKVVIAAGEAQVTGEVALLH